jgi:hypothetical protein
VYGLVRAFFSGGVLILIGMCIGGDAHQAAFIVSGIFGWLFSSPLLAGGLILGSALGIWIGHERAITRLGERDMATYRARIKAGG